MKNITIIGRRWFNTTSGNTYFSSQIYVDGNLVHTIPYAYGYGSHYMDESTDWLEKNNYLPGRTHSPNGSTEPVWSYAERKGIQLVYSATDVSRKKDL
jgi:hypothetical protein